MATLSSNDRAAVSADFQQRISNIQNSIAVTKPELNAAINAIDQWADDNAASFNSAIPQPARGALTQKQKAWLLALVILRRFEVTP